jgi:hypothetical protein
VVVENLKLPSYGWTLWLLAGVKDTVIIEERIGGAGAGGTERAEQEEVESGLNAAAGADRQPGVQDEAAQGNAHGRNELGTCVHDVRE